MKNKIYNAYQHYKEKFFDPVINLPSTPWEYIFDRIRQFKQNEDSYFTNLELRADWLGFLKFLIYTESTIERYDYFSKGPLWRGFTQFGRSFIEEAEALTSERAKKEQLKLQDPNAKNFNGGNPKFDKEHPTKNADFVSELTGKTYDLKHEQPYFSAAHFSELLAYKPLTGELEHYNYYTHEYLGVFDKVRPLKKVVESRGLDMLLFESKASEGDIEMYLGIYVLDKNIYTYLFSDF